MNETTSIAASRAGSHRYLPARVSAIALLAVLCAFGRAQNFEPLKADYSNLRGINYFPAYTTGSLTPASPTGMWLNYDDVGQTGADVDQQLDWARKCGFNTIRLFLSFPMWYAYRNQTPNPHVTRFGQVLAKCYAKGIQVMPVLWDTITFSAALPSYTNLQLNELAWHDNPGDPMITQILGQLPATPFDQTDAGLYIRAFLAEAAQHGSTVLMWDAMNEPHLQGNHFQWVDATLATIKQYAPMLGATDLTTVGTAGVSDGGTALPAFSPSVAIAKHPNVDVLCFHFYGQSRAHIETALYDVTYYQDYDPVTGQPVVMSFDKPVVLSEAGYPGIGLSYRDTVGYCAGVPHPNGDGGTGVGFMPWTLMVAMPFPNGTGMFYADPHPTPGHAYVREPDAVMAFVENAIAQGCPWQSSLWTLAELDGSQSPSWVDPEPYDGWISPAWDEFQVLSDLVNLPAWVWQLQGVWTWDSPLSTPTMQPSFADVTRLFCHVVRKLEIASVCSQNNGNPTAARPAGHDPISDDLIYHYCAARPYCQDQLPMMQCALCTMNQQGVVLELGQMFHDLETAWLNQVPPQFRNGQQHDWLHPWDPNDPYQAQWVSITMQSFVKDFAQLLQPYVNGRGGPY